MKKRISIIAIAIVTIVTFGVVCLSSCEKENNRNNNNYSNSEKSVANPYNYVGTIHNDVVLEVGQSLKDTLDFYAQKSVMSDADYARLMNHVTAEMLDVFDKEYPDYMQVVDDLGGINAIASTDEVDEDDPLYVMIADLLDDSYTTEELISNVDAMVATVMNQQGVDTSITSQKLMVLSVMKNSLILWKDAFENENNPWHNYVLAEYNRSNDSKGLFKKLINKIKKALRDDGATIAIVDAAGAVDGVYFFVKSGCPVGFWGCLGCVITGAAFHSLSAAILS